MRISLNANAKGTIAFPAHSTHHIDVVVNWNEYIDELLNLPKECHPVAVCLYFLDVQKMRDGKPFDQPFESSGREIFENGYKFRMNFRSADEGYFYFFNEGKDTNGQVNYNILHPIPIPGKDQALSEKNKIIQTEWNIFGGTAEMEKVWLIWTKNKQELLEGAVKEAFNQMGRVADSKKKEELRKFIAENNQQKLNSELEKGDSTKRIKLTGESDIIVYLIELEHR